MISIQKVESKDFDRILPLLQELDPSKSSADWELIFKPYWENQFPPFGFMLVDDGEVGGFIGTLIIQREIEGKEYKFCNLGSWIVKSSYRNKSLPLLAAVLNQKEFTYTSFSANKRAHEVLKKFGMKEYQANWKWVLPTPFFRYFNDIVSMSLEKTYIHSRLNSEHLKIFKDHKDFNCVHMLVESKGGGYCYIILKTRSVRKLPCVEVHYASNYQLLFKNINSIVNFVSYKLHVMGALIPENKIQNSHMPFSPVIKLIFPRLYKSSELPAGTIDTLYSEIFILNF